MSTTDDARAEEREFRGIDDDGEEMDLEFCDHCGEDFRYDDCGGYNPPCKCGLNCASCCEHGACDREREDRDEDGGSDG